ncbi:DUF2268 domain-containing protein [Rossellomorea sp. BNER]|uniref:DUF2268 domain-containing protein n=1 Tax=Rossellomorea sp. BNER TaxID=2962031 RepID=UPI003AF2DA15|nr:DUF2268 domain-containing protein [Rossellomorea sp. BNER]
MPTDKWLEKDFLKPLVILEKIGVPENEREEFYRHLQSYGMYRPQANIEEQYLALKKKKAWSTIQQYYKKYKGLWKGPSVPIYIFPIQVKASFFSQGMKKSGVSFKDQVYLFLSSETDEKEWEALFVHEYHHATRMNVLNKKSDQYNLLDAIIFEGLAEQAVKEYCGEKYVSNWTKQYSHHQLTTYWEKYIKKQMSITRTESKHDQLLLGKGMYPSLLGYAVGYYLIDLYKEENKGNTVKWLAKPSPEFLPN